VVVVLPLVVVVVVYDAGIATVQLESTAAVATDTLGNVKRLTRSTELAAALPEIVQLAWFDGQDKGLEAG